MRRLLVTFLLLSIPLQGCRGGHGGADAIPLGTHKVSVSPPCVTKQINNRFPDGGAVYNLTCGETTVTLRNEELLVNEKSYGELSEGDAVHVEGGVVLVNGKRVEARAQR